MSYKHTEEDKAFAQQLLQEYYTARDAACDKLASLLECTTARHFDLMALMTARSYHSLIDTLVNTPVQKIARLRKLRDGAPYLQRVRIAAKFYLRAKHDGKQKALVWKLANGGAQ